MRLREEAAVRHQPNPLFALFEHSLRLAERLQPQRRILEVETLAEAAIRRSGRSDFGAPYHRQGLVQLVDAINDTATNAYGRLLMRTVITQFLETRLHLAEQIPKLTGCPLRPPLIVTGLPRTGTTFLHRMLASDPRHHAPPYWQLAFPVPRGPADTPERRRSAAEQHLRPRRWFTPELDGIHYIRVDEPEECMFMLGLTFESFVYWVLLPLDNYLDWYLAQDHREKYREYALLLRALQTSAPDRHLALKAPAHVDALDALIAAVPDAMIVQTHRDPVQTCASWCSLNFQTQRVGVERLDPRRSAARNVRLLEQLTAKNLAARQPIGNRILDIRYDDLVADPVGTVRHIYRHFGLPFGHDAERAIEHYRMENPKGRHGGHRYRLDDFGLEVNEIDRRFEAYRERLLTTP